MSDGNIINLEERRRARRNPPSSGAGPTAPRKLRAFVRGDRVVFAVDEDELGTMTEDNARRAAEMIGQAAGDLHRVKLKEQGRCLLCGKKTSECRGHGDLRRVHFSPLSLGALPACLTRGRHLRFVGTWDKVTCARCLARRLEKPKKKPTAGGPQDGARK